MSNVYQRGTAINLPAKFWKIDPITKANVLANPSAVTFTILSPDDTELVYVFGVDGNVTNPNVGIFICALSPLLPTGIYHVNVVGTGAVEAQSPDDEFTIVDSAVETAAPPPRPVEGPCSQWISGEDVAAISSIDPGSDITLPGGAVIKASYLFDQAAYDATLALFEISNRQFPGYCEQTVRPCQDNCGCGWNLPVSSGFGIFWGWGGGAGWGFGGPWGWGWYNERGDRFGCQPMSKVRLAGTAVEIVEVLIDGIPLPEFDTDGDPNWRLDKWRYLVRMDKPGDGVPNITRFWPGCQNMSLEDTEPGTFSIKYKWGEDVPQLGRDAAAELANQLFLSTYGGICQLPTGVTRVVRTGIEIERGLLATWMDPKTGTGLVHLDLFLQAYCLGSKRAGRKSAIWSPDLQQFARRVGINR